MTPAQTAAALRCIGDTIHEALPDLQPAVARAEEDDPSGRVALAHALWMRDRAKHYLKVGRFTDAATWTGFAACILWMTGLKTLGELRAFTTVQIPAGSTALDEGEG